MRSARLLTLLALFGCSKPDTKGEPKGLPPSAMSAATPLPVEARPFAEKLASCKFDPMQGLDGNCRTFASWMDATDGFEDGRADTWLVLLLSSSDPKWRYLATRKLEATGQRYREEEGLVVRVIEAAERERLAPVGSSLGRLLARVRIDRVSVLDRIRMLALRHELLPLRVSLLQEIAFYNQGSRAVFELVRDCAELSVPEIRIASMDGLWTGGVRRPVETCAVWRKHVDDASSDEVAARAGLHLTGWGHCHSDLGEWMRLLEARVHADRLPLAAFMESCTNICKDNGADSLLKRRALRLAVDVATRVTAFAEVRSSALQAAVVCDKTEGVLLAQRLARDSNSHVAEVARTIVVGK